MTALLPFVDLSIVVPAYNEELRIPPTLARLHAFLATQPLRYEIVVVDDGSKDNTCGVVEGMKGSIANLRLEKGRIAAGSTLFHEVSHQLLFESAGRSHFERNTGNFWLWEALGTYFETVEPQPDSDGGRARRRTRAVVVSRASE